MTVTHGYAPPPPAGVPGPPPGLPSYGWVQPEPPRPRRGMAIALAGVGLLAATAIGLSIVSLTRTATPAASTSSTTSSASATPVDTAAATHDLCAGIGPLLSANDRTANAYLALGAAGTPARDAATPKFINDTNTAITQIQDVLDRHPDADPFLRRALQRHVDDQHLITADLSAGPFQDYDQVVWADHLAAYSGVLTVCSKAGVKW